MYYKNYIGKISYASKRDRDRSSIWKFAITSRAKEMARAEIKGGKLNRPARRRCVFFSTYRLYFSYRNYLKRYQVSDRRFTRCGSLADE